MKSDLEFEPIHYFEFNEKPVSAWNILFKRKVIGTLINHIVSTQGENSYQAMIDQCGDDRDGMHTLGSATGNWFPEATKLVAKILNKE